MKIEAIKEEKQTDGIGRGGMELREALLRENKWFGAGQ